MVSVRRNTCAQPDRAQQKVVDAYQAKFNVYPENLNVISGYAGVMMLAEAIKAAGSTDTEAVAKAMSAQTNLQLPGFTVIRWVDNYTESTVSIVGYDENGEFKEVTRIDPTRSEGGFASPPRFRHYRFSRWTLPQAPSGA